MVLLDTNILIYSKLATSSYYSTVTDRIVALLNADEDLVICPQIIYEFFFVATKSTDKGGLGLTPTDAQSEIQNLLNTYTLINDPNTLFDTWRTTISTHSVPGKAGHDARIVAFMQDHSIDRLYTINISDFTRFVPTINLI